jgi:hypothetical protein
MIEDVPFKCGYSGKGIYRAPTMGITKSRIFRRLQSADSTVMRMKEILMLFCAQQLWSGKFSCAPAFRHYFDDSSDLACFAYGDVAVGIRAIRRTMLGRFCRQFKFANEIFSDLPLSL